MRLFANPVVTCKVKLLPEEALHRSGSTGFFSAFATQGQYANLSVDFIELHPEVGTQVAVL